MAVLLQLLRIGPQQLRIGHLDSFIFQLAQSSLGAASTSIELVEKAVDVHVSEMGEHPANPGLMGAS